MMPLRRTLRNVSELAIVTPTFAASAYYQEIVKGMIIVAAVIADQYRQRKRKRG
jgi:ribose/xylose/arabinose/galactoside ABC-type transport system permease subunit